MKEEEGKESSYSVLVELVLRGTICFFFFFFPPTGKIRIAKSSIVYFPLCAVAVNLKEYQEVGLTSAFQPCLELPA